MYIISNKLYLTMIDQFEIINIFGNVFEKTHVV